MILHVRGAISAASSKHHLMAL